MRIAVINTGRYDQVLRRTFSTREWEAYERNAQDIIQALQTLGHDVFRFTDGKNVICMLEGHNIEVAWVCSGGIQGWNSAAHLPGILEMLGIPYVGSPPLAAAMADHKPTAKKILAFAGLRTPAFQVFCTPDDELDERLEFPLVVKPATGLCSCGVYHVSDTHELCNRVEQVMQSYHSEVLVEEFVPGQDLTVPILVQQCPIALPIVERHFYQLDDPVGKGRGAVPEHPRSTLAETSSFPSDLSPEVFTALPKLAVEAFVALGLRYFARLDFRVNETGIPYFLEANHKPDLTENGLFAQSARRLGIRYQELIDDLLQMVLDKAGGPDGPEAAGDGHHPPACS